jgi:hypothetical protein
MKRKTVTAAIAGALLILASVTACTSSGGGQEAENAQQTQDTNSLEASQPIPHFSYSQIRQTLIDAEKIASDGTQTTSFFFQQGDQNPVFSCPSLGMPVANTAQLSNPDQIVGTGDNNAVTIGQMDPDGVYAPSASTGTYVICDNDAGQPYLEYWEGDVMTVAAGAEWDDATHSMKVIGAPTAAIETAPAATPKK